MRSLKIPAESFHRFKKIVACFLQQLNNSIRFASLCQFDLIRIADE